MAKKKTCPTALTLDERISASYKPNLELIDSFLKTAQQYEKHQEELKKARREGYQQCKKEVESMKRGVEKEVKEDCWLCHEQLPYADYWYLLRDVDDKVSALEPHSVLVDTKCLELVLELMYYKEGKKDKPVVFEICKKYVHKECGDKVVRKGTLERCIEFALIGEPYTFSPYDTIRGSPRTDAYLNLRVIK